MPEIKASGRQLNDFLYTPCLWLAGLKTPNKIQPGEYSKGGVRDGFRHFKFDAQLGRQPVESRWFQWERPQLQQLELGWQQQSEPWLFSSDGL